MATVSLHLSQDAEADALLSRDPVALLIGMVLDQQVPLEWAFAGPAELSRRLGGHLDPQAIAAMDPEALAAVFAQRPALHRYPRSMAERVRQLCEAVVEGYGGHAERVWTEAASGDDLVRRVKALPGFGLQKARIFTALVGKQLGVRPAGWRQACSPYGEPNSFLSVADITDEQSLAKVRDTKQQLKAGSNTARSTAAHNTAGPTAAGAGGAKAARGAAPSKRPGR